MTKKDCKWIACVYAMASGCSIGNPKETCAYYGDGSCMKADCRCCSRKSDSSCSLESGYMNV
jgi:hypothetical protein